MPDRVHDQVLRLRGQVKAGRGVGLVRRWQLKLQLQRPGILLQMAWSGEMSGR